MFDFLSSSFASLLPLFLLIFSSFEFISEDFIIYIYFRKRSKDVHIFCTYMLSDEVSLCLKSMYLTVVANIT